MDQYTAVNAILHLVAGGEAHLAGVIFFHALRQYPESGEVANGDLLPRLWLHQPLPEGIEPNLQFGIRAAQLRVLNLTDENVTDILADLDRLVAASTAEQKVGLAGLLALSHPILVRTDFSRFNQYLRRFLGLPRPERIRHTGRRSDKTDSAFPEDLDEHTFLWLAIQGLDSGEKMQAWLDTVLRLSPENRAKLFAEPRSKEGAIALASSLVVATEKKAVPERDWEGVCREMGLLAQRAVEAGFSALWAAAIRTQVMITGENLKRYPDAENVARRALTTAGLGPFERFLISSMAGRQAVMAGRMDRASGLADSD